MAKKDTSINLKKRLKNTNAKLKRRDDKIARLEAKVAQMEADAKKKASPQTMDRVLQNIPKGFQGISSQSSLSSMQLRSDAKQTAVLETLLRLLKD